MMVSHHLNVCPCYVLGRFYLFKNKIWFLFIDFLSFYWYIPRTVEVKRAKHWTQNKNIRRIKKYITHHRIIREVYLQRYIEYNTLQWKSSWDHVYMSVVVCMSISHIYMCFSVCFLCLRYNVSGGLAVRKGVDSSQRWRLTWRSLR